MIDSVIFPSIDTSHISLLHIIYRLILLLWVSEFVIVQFSDPADVESSTEERVEHKRKELHAFFEQNRMEKLLKGYNADTDRYYDYFEG